MNVLVYDKCLFGNARLLGIWDKIAKICKERSWTAEKKSQRAALANLGACDAVFGHFPEDMKLADLPGFSGAGGQVLVFMTAQGGLSEKSRMESGRCLLYAHRMDYLDDEPTLRRILEAAASGKDILEECRTWPKDPFHSDVRTTLVALGILCQGYLAVYAESFPKEKWTPEAKEVLEKHMLWQSEGKELASNYGEVNDRDWWLQCFGGNPDDLAERIRLEQGSPSPDMDALIAAFKKADGKGRMCDGFPETVARAYLAISERIEAGMDSVKA